MADPACTNDSASLIGATTTSVTEDVYDPAGTDASGIDLTPYINYKTLFEEVGCSNSTDQISVDADNDGVPDAGGDSGVAELIEDSIETTYGVGFVLTDSSGNVTGSNGYDYEANVNYNLTNYSGSMAGQGAVVRLSSVGSGGQVIGTTITFVNGGAGYSVGDILLISGGCGCSYIKVIKITISIHRWYARIACNAS